MGFRNLADISNKTVNRSPGSNSCAKSMWAAPHFTFCHVMVRMLIRPVIGSIEGGVER